MTQSKQLVNGDVISHYGQSVIGYTECLGQWHMDYVNVCNNYASVNIHIDTVFCQFRIVTRQELILTATGAKLYALILGAISRRSGEQSKENMLLFGQLCCFIQEQTDNVLFLQPSFIKLRSGQLIQVMISQITGLFIQRQADTWTETVSSKRVLILQS